MKFRRKESVKIYAFQFRCLQNSINHVSYYMYFLIFQLMVPLFFIMKGLFYHDPFYICFCTIDIRERGPFIIWYANYNMRNRVERYASLSTNPLRNIYFELIIDLIVCDLLIWYVINNRYFRLGLDRIVPNKTRNNLFIRSK